MACSHNQRKIDAINNQITANEDQITTLEGNITKCTTIRDNHDKFNEKVNCVINNLEGNTVFMGAPYDNGKMTSCLESSKETITDCDTIISESNKKIQELQRVNLSLEQSIASLQGTCYECRVAEEQARYGGRRRVTK